MGDGKPNHHRFGSCRGACSSGYSFNAKEPDAIGNVTP